MTVALWFARDAHDAGEHAPRWESRVDDAASHVPRPTATITDEERALLARIRQSDQSAFDALAGQHWEALWRFAYRHLRSSETAADVVQDVLFGVWQRRTQLDEGRPMRPYLFGAVRRRALELLRHERTVARAQAQHDPATVSGIGTAPSDSANDVEQQEFVAALERLLSTVPAERREILALRWWHGLPYNEIAEIVGLGESAVKMTVHRAVKQFRPLLERQFER
jgi:RNA polymerase sigma-70 factor (ECF subfamily)